MLTTQGRALGSTSLSHPQFPAEVGELTGSSRSKGLGGPPWPPGSPVPALRNRVTTSAIDADRAYLHLLRLPLQVAPNSAASGHNSFLSYSPGDPMSEMSPTAATGPPTGPRSFWRLQGRIVPRPLQSAGAAHAPGLAVTSLQLPLSSPDSQVPASLS